MKVNLCLSFVIVVFLAVSFWVNAGEAAEVKTGNIVKVTGIKGQWQLSVNGEVFPIKGVGVGRAAGRDGTDFLFMAKDMGANTVRTWGVNQGDRRYLDTAEKYGLKVDAGIWLNPVTDYSKHSYLDKRFLNKTRQDILRYIRKYKNHPAVLLWNIGNEVVFFTKSEQERVAFCQFLESVIQDVHKLDPNHPVIYTSSAMNDVAYLKNYVPSLDIVGINTYGGIEKIHQDLTAMFDIPYLITEFGSLGEWDRDKDNHGVSFELNDDSKMSYYKQLAYKIKGYSGYCLGGFVFLLGDTTQVSLTWWNINQGHLKKYPYLVMEDFYKNKEFRRAPFIVKDIHLSRNNLKPLEEFDVTVDVKNVVDKEQAIEYSYLASTVSEAVLIEYPNKRIPIGIQGQGSHVRIKAPRQPGTYRIYAVASNGEFASTFNRSIKVSKVDGTTKVKTEND
jgi:hypothetical protein